MHKETLTKTDIRRIVAEVTGATRFSESDELLARAVERQVQQRLAERFEQMHANGDVWITTIAAAKLAAPNTPAPAGQS